METTMRRKSLVDYISDADYPRYVELLNKAEQLKAAAPKAERKPRGPMTTEQKKASLEARMKKYEAQLAALLAEQE